MPAGPCTGALRRKLPTGHPSGAGRRGTCPLQVLETQEIDGGSRRPARLREIIPRSHPERYRDPRLALSVHQPSFDTAKRRTRRHAPGNPPSPTPIPSRRFRSGAAFGVRWRAGSLGRCGRSGRTRPGRAARPITAIRAAGRAVCHPKGRSGAEDARSALTRRPSRSYAAPTSRQACRASRGRVRTEEHDPAGVNGPRMPAPGSPSWPPTGSCRRWSSRHARSPWAARQPPVPTDPDRRPARATPRSRTR